MCTVKCRIQTYWKHVHSEVQDTNVLEKHALGSTRYKHSGKSYTGKYRTQAQKKKDETASRCEWGLVYTSPSSQQYRATMPGLLSVLPSILRLPVFYQSCPVHCLPVFYQSCSVHCLPVWTQLSKVEVVQSKVQGRLRPPESWFGMSHQWPTLFAGLACHVTPMINTVSQFGTSGHTNDQHCQLVWHVMSHQWSTLSGNLARHITPMTNTQLVWHVTPMTNTVSWFGVSRHTNDQHCQPVWHITSHQWPTLSAVWACPPMTKQHLDSQKLNKYILLTHMNRYTSKYRCRPTHLQYTQLYIHRHYGGQRSNRPGSDHQNTCTLSSVTKRKSLKQINSTCNCLILVKVSPDFFLLMLLYLYSEGSATNFTWWLNVAHQPFTVTYQQLSVAC